MIETCSRKLPLVPGKEQVSTLLDIPSDAQALLVLGHGAGSRLDHPLLTELSRALHARAIATFRFNYPYSERGRGMDPESVRLACVRAAVAAAAAETQLPLFAGGHSMSGRMASMAQARSPLSGVLGLISFAFPLHPGATEIKRAEHLRSVQLPMLFVSGTRDKMAVAPYLETVVRGLENARLYRIDTADHGFKVLKRRSSDVPVMDEVAEVSASWIKEILAPHRDASSRP